ncbi:hypothetical protein ACN5O8_07920 [Aliarcobacter butzleri]|uniref:hypothetical protein n=1 Tax=Aliarcobacter butzleri TaxID=28197 RepID=UPI003AF6D53B
MITYLTETIAKENNFTVIKKLDDNTKQYLKEHIQNSILERYDYQPLEHIQVMIDLITDDNYGILEINAINYIESINYTINDKFYEKLKEPYINSNDLDFEDYDDNFDIPLNEYTLMDWIEFNIIDAIDLTAEKFEENYKNTKFFDYYKQVIQDNLELHFKHKNREIETKQYKSKEEAIQGLLNFNREPLDYENIKLKKDLEPLTKREINLITVNAILIADKNVKIFLKENIANNYNINNNLPQTNQKLLNNSYDVIIDTLKNLSNTDDIISLLENEKSINDDLFTNAKKLSKVKSNNHYMSFLYKCNSVWTQNQLIVFQEFVEALISGYMQFLEFEDKEQKIKSYNHDLEVLKRYNTSNENDKNIQELEDNINFLSISKPHQKFIPFKELSNRLEIDKNQITNYITNILNNGTHKNTIKQNFDTLITIPKEICISKF